MSIQPTAIPEARILGNVFQVLSEAVDAARGEQRRIASILTELLGLYRVERRAKEEALAEIRQRDGRIDELEAENAKLIEQNATLLRELHAILEAVQNAGKEIARSNAALEEAVEAASREIHASSSLALVAGFNLAKSVHTA